jgi:uncharacterized protein YneF (UPF0154 family)
MFTYVLVAILACFLGLIAGITIGFVYAVDRFDKTANKK